MKGREMADEDTSSEEQNWFVVQRPKKKFYLEIIVDACLIMCGSDEVQAFGATFSNVLHTDMKRLYGLAVILGIGSNKGTTLLRNKHKPLSWTTQENQKYEA